MEMPFGMTREKVALSTPTQTSLPHFAMLCQIRVTANFTEDPLGILFPFYGKLPAALQLFLLFLLAIIIFPMTLPAPTTIGKEKLRTLQLVTAPQLTT
jgi:hypothetical protein